MAAGRWATEDFRRVNQVETLYFDDVEVVDTASSTTATTADGGSTVTVRRPGPRTDERVLIGTRTADELVAEIDGRPIRLELGPAKLTKASYRITIAFDESRLRLEARSLSTSEIVSERAEAGNDVLGNLHRLQDGSLLLLWKQPFTVMKQTVTPPLPTRDETLVALAVGSAVGIGGLSAATILTSAVDSILLH